jgi:hypothetical protein
MSAPAGAVSSSSSSGAGGGGSNLCVFDDPNSKFDGCVFGQ